MAASIINKTDSENITKKKVKMFEFLMKRLKVIDWQYGPITMSTFNLEGIEINYPVLERYEIDELKHFVVSVEGIEKKLGEDLYLTLEHYKSHKLLINNKNENETKLIKWGKILMKKMKTMHPAISW